MRYCVPASVYDHPRDVVGDRTISIGEKRAILASWASEAEPPLRQLPGSHKSVSIDEVLEALSALDQGPKAPWGGNLNRQQMTTKIDEKLALLRTHRNNISRYHRLLKTELTELERQYVLGRLAEERSAIEELAASTFPLQLGI